MLLLTLGVMIISTFEHVYIITAWRLTYFNEMNDSENVLLKSLLLSGKSPY